MKPLPNSSSPFLASSRKGKKSSSFVRPSSLIIRVCISDSVKTPSGGFNIGGLTHIQLSGKLALKNVVSTFSYWVAAGRKYVASFAVSVRATSITTEKSADCIAFLNFSDSAKE